MQAQRERESYDIDFYIAQALEKQQHDRRGGNSKAFLLGDKVLLYGPIEPDIDLQIEEQNELIAQGVNIMPILQYKVTDKLDGYDRGYVLQERAKGVELTNWVKRGVMVSSASTDDGIKRDFGRYVDSLREYQERLSQYSDAPQEHINKFVSGLLSIGRSDHLSIDPSKPGNFFYDEDEGFSFIDINRCKTKEGIAFTDESHAQYILMLLLNIIQFATIDGTIGGDPAELPKMRESYATLQQKILNALRGEGFAEDQIDQLRNVNGGGDQAIELMDRSILRQYSKEEQIAFLIGLRDELKQKESSADDVDIEEDWSDW